MRKLIPIGVLVLLLSITVLAQGPPTVGDKSFSYSFKTGWNLVSSPQEQGLALATIEAEPDCKIESYAGVKLWGWNAAAQDWDKDETSLKPGNGYWIKIQSACDLTALGADAELTTVSLNPGWNLVSAQGKLSDIMGTCLGKLSSYKGETVWYYNPETEQWEHPEILEGTKGYWIPVEESCALKYSITTPTIPISCDTDTKICPDGTVLMRNPTTCEFSACPTTGGSTPREDDMIKIPDSAEACPVGQGVIADIQAHVRSVATDDKYVYWSPAVGQNFGNPTSILRATKKGTDLTTFTKTQSAASDITRKNDYVYWTERVARFVKRMNADGSGAIATSKLPQEPENLLVDAGTLYWIGRVQGHAEQDSILTAKSDLAEIKTFVAAGSMPGRLAMDTTQLYFTGSSKSGKGLFVVPKTGGTPSLAIPSMTAAFDVDDEYIYYAENIRVVFRGTIDAKTTIAKTTVELTNIDVKLKKATVKLTFADGAAKIVTLVQEDYPATVGGLHLSVSSVGSVSGKASAIVTVVGSNLHWASKSGTELGQITIPASETVYRNKLTFVEPKIAIIEAKGGYAFFVSGGELYRFDSATKTLTRQADAAATSLAVDNDGTVYWGEGSVNGAVYRAASCKSSDSDAAIKVPELAVKYENTEAAASCPVASKTLGKIEDYSRGPDDSDDALFWSFLRGKSYNPTQLKTVSKEGGSSKIVADTDKVTSTPYSILYDSGKVYWSEAFSGGATTRYGSIKRVAADGSGYTVVAVNEVGPTSLLADEQYVYWLDTSSPTGETTAPGNRVMRIKKDLSDVKTVIVTNARSNKILVDDTHVYYHNSDFLMKAAKNGGQEEILLPGSERIAMLLDQDKNYLYYANTTNAIKRIPKTGGPSQIVMPFTKGMLMSTVTIKGDYIYFVNGTSKAIFKLPKTGSGKTIKIGDIGGTGTTSRLLLDAKTIFYPIDIPFQSSGDLIAQPDCKP